MVGPQRSAAPIASSIDVLRRQLGLGRPDNLALLAERWPEMAGDSVADRSKIIDLRQGMLTVDAYDPATAELLNWSKQRLLAEARVTCPSEQIIDLTVRVRRAERAPKR
jgi:hypothetical protein